MSHVQVVHLTTIRVLPGPLGDVLHVMRHRLHPPLCDVVGFAELLAAPRHEVRVEEYAVTGED